MASDSHELQRKGIPGVVFCHGFDFANSLLDISRQGMDVPNDKDAHAVLLQLFSSK